MSNKLRTWFKENRELGYFVGSVAGFVLLSATLGLFLFFGARGNFAQAEMLKNRLTGIRRFQQQYGNFAARRAELEREFNRLDEELPKSIDANNLLLHINTLATMSNVRIENLIVQPDGSSSQKSAFKSGSIQITCIGQCQQLLDFMKAVEQKENLMLFSDVTMGARENDNVFLSAVINYYVR